MSFYSLVNINYNSGTKKTIKYFDNKNIVIIFDNKFFVMKNIIGAPARKEGFYQRNLEIERILQKIEDGNNLQIAAPRRVGKTSILFSLLDNKNNNHIYVYVDTEAIDNTQDFFKKILKEILKADEIKKSATLKKLFESGNKFLKRIKSVTIAGTGLEFTDSDQAIDYKEEVENLLSGIALENERKLILLIDEFPQTIQNILDANNANTKPAIKFLQSNREIRLNPDINGQVFFIYTGSIGLNHTVSAIDGTAFINDIHSIEVGPLTLEESHELISALLDSKKINISKEASRYLMDKVEWLIPFHIQLAAQEILSSSPTNSQATPQLIDTAFENILARRNNNHFEHYYSRLKKSFKNDAFTFATAVLNKIAEKTTVTQAELFDIAVTVGIQDEWKNIIEILIYDGYINNNPDTNIYRFNSPILRMWWQKFL
jgi:uncharacterized protein